MSGALLLPLVFDGHRSDSAFRPSFRFGSRMANSVFATVRVFSMLCPRGCYFSLIKFVLRVVSICVFLSCLAPSRAVAQYRSMC